VLTPAGCAWTPSSSSHLPHTHSACPRRAGLPLSTGRAGLLGTARSRVTQRSPQRLLSGPRGDPHRTAPRRCGATKARGEAAPGPGSAEGPLSFGPGTPVLSGRTRAGVRRPFGSGGRGEEPPGPRRAPDRGTAAWPLPSCACAVGRAVT